MAAGSRLSALPMLHLVAALPAEAQNEGSSQGSLAGTESAPDKVIDLTSLAMITSQFPYTLSSEQEPGCYGIVFVTSCEIDRHWVHMLRRRRLHNSTSA